jgi:hypothetical protein
MSGSTRTFSANNSAVALRGSKVYKAVIAMEISAADLATTGDVVPLMELPPEAIVTSIKHLNDDLDSGSPALAVDVGIWRAIRALSLDEIVAESAYEAAAQDIYADGLATLSAAVTTLTEILGSGSSAVDLDDRFETVRELAGDTLVSGAMPSKYFLGLKTTIDAATAVAGGVYFEVEYVQG